MFSGCLDCGDIGVREGWGAVEAVGEGERGGGRGTRQPPWGEEEGRRQEGAVVAGE